VAKNDFNTIIKFADGTTVVGLITDNDEKAYREEVRELVVWYQNNHLSLNVSKTKELIVEYRKRRAEQAPIDIDWAVAEWVESFKFLGLSWSKHTKTVMKRAQQNIFHLSRLKRFEMGPQILKGFYSCTIESILSNRPGPGILERPCPVTRGCLVVLKKVISSPS
jgi:hypothetical protein